MSNLALGVIAFLIGLVMLIMPNNKYKPVDAKVVKVEEFYTSEDDFEYRIRAEYYVDGKKYEAYYDGTPSIQEGDTVKLEYSTVRPANFRTAGADILPFILMGAGALFAVVGIFPLMKRREGFFGK